MDELKKLIFSFGYALRGIGYAIRTQRNMRIHLTALATVIVFNCMVDLSVTHWCMEILCCMAVISLELVNTALETACDKITSKQHPLIGHAKDAAAGAVLVSAIGSVVIALLIFRAYVPQAAELLRLKPWIQYALMAGAIAALVFIFLPSALQKRKKK